MSPLERAVLRLPESCREGLLDYLRLGVPPGRFLRAVLENDLMAACASADEINRRVLSDYVFVLYNYAPAEAWGDPERVSAWIQRGTERRQASPHIDISQWVHDGNSTP